MVKKEEKKDWFGSSKKDSNWFKKLRSNLVSNSDLNDDESLSNDQLTNDQSNESSKDASKSKNYSISWQYFSNFNFSNHNLSNLLELPTLPKFNYTNNLLNLNSTNILNLNNSKDWLLSWSLATFKAKYYGDLLNNKTITEITPSLDTSTTSPISSNLSSTYENNTSANMNYTLFRDRLYTVYNNFAACDHPCYNGMNVIYFVLSVFLFIIVFVFSFFLI